LRATAAERAIRYLERLSERGVAPDPIVVTRLAELAIPLPTDPSSADETMALLDSYSAATMAMAGPRFFGFVIGGSLPAALAANWLASAWDQNTGLYNSTPGTSHLEQVSLRWLLELLDLPRESAGAFVTGTTVAHITALAAARHAVLAKAGWDVEADGLFGAPEVTVITGAEAHPTLYKALGVIGFGRKRVVKVPVDDQGRMRVDQFPKIKGPTVVCLQVGNVNSGACDDVKTLGRMAREQGA